MRHRLLILLTRLFPASYRDTRQSEILDALGEGDLNRRQSAREAAGLIWAAQIAWHRRLDTWAAARTSLYVGAVVWAGVLIGIGPVSRAVPGNEDFWQMLGVRTDRFLIPAILMMLAIAALLWSRVASGSLAAAGIIMSGYANQNGGWGWADHSLYELRWIGAAVLIAILLAGRTRPRGAIVLSLAATAAAAAVTAGVWGWGWNYGLAISEYAPDLLMTNNGFWDDVALLSVTAAALMAPWYARAGWAVFVVPTVHLALAQPWPIVAVFGYVLGVEALKRTWQGYELRIVARR